MDLRDTGRTQRTIYAGSHVQGSPDGIIYSGLPEAMKTMHVWECKTHSKKSFDELVKHGVQKAKPMHYIQMQCSMTAGNINRALYYAVCKDDDRIYTERIHVETVLGHKHLERGKALALSERIPEPISADPSWYQCKLCAAHGFCHEGDHTKEISCRSCAHSTPTQKGTWTCSRWNNAEIPPDAQYEGCRAHVFHPDLVKWKILEDRCSQWTACWEIDGTQIRNGEDGYSSREILTGGPFHDPVVDMARDVFGGEIVDYAAPIPS